MRTSFRGISAKCLPSGELFLLNAVCVLENNRDRLAQADAS